MRRGHVDLTLGTGHDLATWHRLGLGWTRQWTDAVQTTLSGTYGAQPSATVPLFIAGLADRLEAQIAWQVTPRDTLQAQIRTERLRAQGGGQLGDSQSATATFSHKFWFAPPDFTVDVTLNANHYQHAGQLPKQLTSLVPSGQTPNIGFFVPDSYLQACIGGSFNTHYQSDYAAKFRPYARIGLCANSAYGPAYDVKGGFALPIFGPDHLSLSADINNALGVGNTPNIQITLAYRYYFLSLP